MDNSKEITEMLTEIRDQLREGGIRNAETMEFLRVNAERSRVMVDRSVALQEQALRRQKSALALVLPIIIVCVGVLAWLIFGVGRR